MFASLYIYIYVCWRNSKSRMDFNWVEEKDFLIDSLMKLIERFIESDSQPSIHTMLPCNKD